MQSVEVQAAGRRFRARIIITREEGGDFSQDVPGRDVEREVDVSGYVFETADNYGASLLESSSSLSDEERALAEEALIEAFRQYRDEINATLNGAERDERCRYCSAPATQGQRYCSRECCEADQ